MQMQSDNHMRTQGEDSHLQTRGASEETNAAYNLILDFWADLRENKFLWDSVTASLGYYFLAAVAN